MDLHLFAGPANNKHTCCMHVCVCTPARRDSIKQQKKRYPDKGDQSLMLFFPLVLICHVERIWGRIGLGAGIINMLPIRNKEAKGWVAETQSEMIFLFTYIFHKAACCGLFETGICVNPHS